MVAVLTSAVGLVAGILAAGIWHRGDDLNAVRVNQALAASGDRQGDQCYQKHSPQWAPPTRTQMNETRAFSFWADSSTAFATCGPAASHSPLLANPGTEVAARTSAGSSRNHTISVHMGASVFYTPGGAF